jgi:hypothetical protein
MNFARGLFRLWICVATLWVIASVWVLYDDLLERPWTLKWPAQCKEVERGDAAHPDRFSMNCGNYMPDQAIPPIGSNRGFAVQVVALPPIALLVIGFAGFWVARGFRVPRSGPTQENKP